MAGGARCPVDHTAISASVSHRKTARSAEPPGAPALERDAAGVWHVRGFAEAQAILRGPGTRQAGFKAELLERMPAKLGRPILYQEGQAHLQQRKQTARFFTPTATRANYRGVMESLSDELIAELQRTRRADLSQLSLRLAVRVAAEVVGLTGSRWPGMDRRLDAFFEGGAGESGGGRWPRRRLLLNQWRMLRFYLLDVRPAIRARRRQPRADVISHLLEQGYPDAAILTECLTYGAAGMATTREFISVAAWHFLEQPALRAHYLGAPEAERYQILHETLRVEPVVAHLYRRATADVRLASQGQPVTIPAGSLIDLHIHAANADEAVTGPAPLAICPGRPLNAERTTPALLSFGDGHHRCPGAYIAIQESDIFLQRLLRLEGLRLERAPAVSWNELTQSYELRQFLIRLDL